MDEINICKIIEDFPYDLLLLADETREAIEEYLFDSSVYIAKIDDNIIGVFCLLPIDEETVEIMNIAVSSEMQSNGIGSCMMDEIEKIARKEGYKTIIVGTADFGLKQIRFYEKNGYSKYDLKKDYFLEKFGEPIYEDGVLLKDMIMLKKSIIHDPQTEQEQEGDTRDIKRAEKSDYGQIMNVWENSVRSTHHFLKPEDFKFYKDIIPGYLPNVDLYVIRTGDRIDAFMGVSGDSLEMLFVSGDLRGRGYGKDLLLYALKSLNVKRVDVNEQNSQALGFYQKFGFNIVSRSEKDSTGKKYPILHLSL